MSQLCEAAMAGRVEEARSLHLKLLSLHKNLFVEPSPAPTKWALSRLNRCQPHLRLPLVPLTAAGQAAVQSALQDAGLV